MLVPYHWRFRNGMQPSVDRFSSPLPRSVSGIHRPDDGFHSAFNFIQISSVITLFLIHKDGVSPMNVLLSFCILVPLLLTVTNYILVFFYCTVILSDWICLDYSYFRWQKYIHIIVLIYAHYRLVVEVTLLLPRWSTSDSPCSVTRNITTQRTWRFIAYLDGLWPILTTSLMQFSWKSERVNPFAPKGDQIYPGAALPEILHHTVRKTWLSLLTHERWLYSTIPIPSTSHLYISLFGRMYFLNLGVKGLTTATIYGITQDCFELNGGPCWVSITFISHSGEHKVHALYCMGNLEFVTKSLVYTVTRQN